MNGTNTHQYIQRKRQAIATLRRAEDALADSLGLLNTMADAIRAKSCRPDDHAKIAGPPVRPPS